MPWLKVFSCLTILKSWKKIVFFVDENHEYEIVKKELSIIYFKALEASVLLHDTFYQSKESEYNCGPIKAVKEFLTRRKDLKVILTNLGFPGMTLIGNTY